MGLDTIQRYRRFETFLLKHTSTQNLFYLKKKLYILFKNIKPILFTFNKIFLKVMIFLFGLVFAGEQNPS